MILALRVAISSLFNFYLLHRQEALLAAISEKDANIALLELSQSRKKSNLDEVAKLKREKERLMYQLKQQVGKTRKHAGLRNRTTTALFLDLSA